MEKVLCALVIFGTTLILAPTSSTIVKPLPEDVLWGVATSAYQTEGEWNTNGKSASVWDHFTHTFPERVADRTNGDVACDSYNRIEEDVALLKNLGVDYYRFSIAWSRILPNGFPNKINKAGVDFYNRLIDALIVADIIPMATIYHWDLPQSLQELGGWANPHVEEWFAKYADVVFDKFGDRVKHWITINEPKQICEFGYGLGEFAPGVNSDGLGSYLCAKNLLKAHARAYHLYKNNYYDQQKGTIGITIETSWSEPQTNRAEDVEAAERRRQFDFGLYANPVFHKNGDFPDLLKRAVENRSLEEGFVRSRLPILSAEEIDYIKGTSDFYGMNHYTTVLVKNGRPAPLGKPSQENDLMVETHQDPKWITGSYYYFRSVPWGFKKALNYIKDTYENPEIFITENGFPVEEGFEDKTRIKFFQDAISAMIDGIKEDGLKIKGYTAWTFLDNFEWISGYTINFGLYYVNFTDPERPRVPKRSAQFYKDLLSSKKLVLESEET